MLFFHLEDIIFSVEMGLCDRVVYQGEDEDRLREFRVGADAVVKSNHWVLGKRHM